MRGHSERWASALRLLIVAGAAFACLASPKVSQPRRPVVVRACGGIEVELGVWTAAQHRVDLELRQGCRPSRVHARVITERGTIALARDPEILAGRVLLELGAVPAESPAALEVQLDDDLAFRVGLTGRALSRPQIIEPFQPPAPPRTADVCGGVELQLVGWRPEWRPGRLAIALDFDPQRCQPRRVDARVMTDPRRPWPARVLVRRDGHLEIDLGPVRESPAATLDVQLDAAAFRVTVAEGRLIAVEPIELFAPVP